MSNPSERLSKAVQEIRSVLVEDPTSISPVAAQLVAEVGLEYLQITFENGDMSHKAQLRDVLADYDYEDWQAFFSLLSLQQTAVALSTLPICQDGLDQNNNSGPNKALAVFLADELTREAGQAWYRLITLVTKLIEA